MAEIILGKSDGQQTVSTVTSVISVKDLGNGKYELKEIVSDAFAPPDMHSGDRKQIDFGLPIPGLALVGYVDFGDKEIGAYLTMLGTQVGPKYSAGIENGVELTLDLLLAKGSVRLFGKDNQIKLAYNLRAGFPPFDVSHNDEVVLFGY